eukprot:106598_1
MGLSGLPSCYKLMIFFTTWLIFFNGYFFRNSISPIVDVLEHDLNTNATGVGTLGSFIHLFYFGSQIPYGILLQFFPAKYVLPISSFNLGVSLILFSFSTTITYGTIMSSIAGLAQAPAALCYITIMDDLFTRAQFPLAIGIQMFLTYGGLFSGNYIQAYIYDEYSDWRSVFLVLGFSAIFGGIVFFILLCCGNYDNKPIESYKTSPYKTKHDTSFSGHQLSLHELKNGIKNGHRVSTISNSEYANGYTDQTRLLSDATDSKSNKRKFKELKQALKRAFLLKWNYLISFWGFCGLLLVNSFNGMWFISYLMVKFEYTRKTAALISGSFYLTRATSAPIIGRLAMKFAKRKIFMVIGSIFWICSVAIIYVVQPETKASMGYNGLSVLVLGLNLVSGIGAGNWGLLWALQREYNAYYNCKDAAAGLVNSIQNAAGFVGTLFIGEMLDMRWSIRGGSTNENGDRIYTVQDYDYAFIIIPSVVIGAIISALLIKETHAENVDYSESKSSKKCICCNC